MGNPTLGEQEAKRVYNQIKSGWLSQGKATLEFEQEVSKIISSKFCVAVNNGTSSLHLALLALGVKKGDEVIVPSLTYISSVNAIFYIGAVPVFADCNPRTFNIEADEIAALSTKKTKAVMTTDMKGMPVDFDEIRKAVSFNKLAWLSDSAESIGSSYKGKAVGAQADLHSFSFFANKNITTGEGGMVSGNEIMHAEILKKLRNQGQSARYIHDELGYNYRFNDILACIGLEQIKRLNSVMKRKQQVADLYKSSLTSYDLPLHIPLVPEYVTQHSWFNYCIIFEQPFLRDRAQAHLERNGIETRISFPPCHQQKSVLSLDHEIRSSLETSEELYQTMLDVPCHHNMENSDVDLICSLIKEAL